MSYDRFEHEDAIQSAWNAVDDFKLLAEAIHAGEKSAEEIAVMAMGMSVAYSIKFNTMWELFEASIEGETVEVTDD